MSKQIEQPAEKYDSVFSLFVRIFWTLIGNAIAFFTLIAILRHKGQSFYIADIVFGGTIAALILARFIDFKIWGGTTEKGEPVTIVHCQKYAAILLISASVLWIIAHLINHLFINK